MILTFLLLQIRNGLYWNSERTFYIHSPEGLTRITSTNIRENLSYFQEIPSQIRSKNKGKWIWFSVKTVLNLQQQKCKGKSISFSVNTVWINSQNK